MVRRRRATLCALALTATTVLVTACTSDGERDDESAVGVPESVEAAVSDDTMRQRLSVSFAPVGGAEAYLLTLGDDHTIRVEPDDCSEDTCTITLSRMAAAGAETASVTALTADGESDPSDEVELPAWPIRESPTPPQDQPTELVVTRLGEDGVPVVTTEPVARGEDVEARIAALKGTDNRILGVAPNTVATPLLAIEDAPDPGENGAEGSTTWQTQALEFDALPPEPRGEGVTIAVLDDGVDTAHPSLQGADVSSIESGGTEKGWHDTAITPLIVGPPDGQVPGIASGVTIRDYDFNDPVDPGAVYEGEFGGQYDAAQIAATIVRAVQDGANIVNLSYSFAGGDFEAALRPVVEYAETSGVVVVAAAGNDGAATDACGLEPDDTPNQDQLPAMLPTVIAVGGTNPDGSVWQCSPDKDYVDVLAPAHDLKLADVEGGYFVGSGTSAAAPLVAGFVAVLLAEKPDLTPASVRSLLSQCVAENLRLIPSLCLREAGIDGGPEGPIEDPDSGDQLLPFATQISFPPGHPVYEAADAARNTPHVLLGRWNSSPIGDEPFATQVSGTLVVHDDGGVTGRATLAPLAGDTLVEEGADVDRIGHLVECPVGDVDFGSRSPYLLFDWSLTLDVTGQLDADDAGSDARALDLTFEPRGVSAMNVLADTFGSRCPPAIEASYLVPGEPAPGDYLWAEVGGWRDANIAAIEPVYERFVETGPFTFAGSYAADAGVDNVLGSGEQVDGVGYELRLGSTDTTSF